jgi:hypothetical protein
MPKSSEVHQSLRQEWAETPPDVSYRFVVSQETLQAAETVVSAVRKKKRRRWKRALGFLTSSVLYYMVMTAFAVLLAWLSFEAARLFDVTLLRIIAFLVVFWGSSLVAAFLSSACPNYLSRGSIANSIPTMNSCWRDGHRICGSRNDPPVQSGSGPRSSRSSNSTRGCGCSCDDARPSPACGAS